MTTDSSYHARISQAQQAWVQRWGSKIPSHSVWVSLGCWEKDGSLRLIQRPNNRIKIGDYYPVSVDLRDGYLCVQVTIPECLWREEFLIGGACRHGGGYVPLSGEYAHQRLACAYCALYSPENIGTLETLKMEGLFPPDEKTLRQQIQDGRCLAACKHNCTIPPLVHCTHGRPSWVKVLKMV